MFKTSRSQAAAVMKDWRSAYRSFGTKAGTDTRKNTKKGRAGPALPFLGSGLCDY
jgi:hypothetical protein